MIRYISTRGNAPVLSFEEAVLAGLASDGGLYVPETIPVVSPETLKHWATLPYEALAYEVMAPFVGDALEKNTLMAMLKESYADFPHPDPAPLTPLDDGLYLLELFHGPTLAFKDFALQFLGRALDVFLARRAERCVIVGATSGDTGSAAIAGCRGREHMDIFILHPQGRTSEVQRRQMTTVHDERVHNIAIQGTFDDCQHIVKALFADEPFRARHQLSAVNSINWARILAQVVYYFYAAGKLGAPHTPVRFTVPTGNFGDIFAGYVAKCMGLPIEKLVIATNRNDILARCMATGIYSAEGVRPTLSPSMDIEISSNFERLLFDLHGRDGARVDALLKDFKTEGRLALGAAQHAQFMELFAAGSADDTATLATISEMYATTGRLLDPHTAVGVAVARDYQDTQGKFSETSPMVVLATAHPAKFPDAVEKATSIRPSLPASMADLFTLDEKYTVLANDVNVVQDYINRARH